MTSAAKPGPADFDLAWRLAKRGIKTDAAYLHRLRSEQWIHGPDPVEDGSYVYSPAVEDYTAKLITLLKKRRSLDLATLTLFGQGHIPRETTLKRVYVGEAFRLHRTLLVVSAAAASVQAVAVAVHAQVGDRVTHSPLGRWLSNRLQRLMRAEIIDREEPGIVIGSVVEEVVHIVLTGQPTSDLALQELLDAAGISAMQRDHWGPLQPIIRADEDLVSRDLLRVIRRFQLHDFVARIRQSNINELVVAREDFIALHDLLIDAATVVRFMSPLHDAFGFEAFKRLMILAEAWFGKPVVVARYAPLMLIIKDEVVDYEESLRKMLATAPQLRAVASFVESLPQEYQCRYGVRRVQRLPSAHQRQLALSWIAAHPSAAAAAGIRTPD
jgi:hypothetical protein